MKKPKNESCIEYVRRITSCPCPESNVMVGNEFEGKILFKNL